MDEGSDFLELATAALAAWSQALTTAAARRGPMQHVAERDAARAQLAGARLAAGDSIRVRCQASVTIARSADDDPYFQRSRYWELRIDGEQVVLRGWENFADEVGASQSEDPAVTGGLWDVLPAGALIWASSLAEALGSGRCRLDVEEPGAAAP